MQNRIINKIYSMSVLFTYFVKIWIMRHIESPRINQVDPTPLFNLVNWSYSYRRDSTIQAPYGMAMRIEATPNAKAINYAAGKTKKVAWFVSNCGHTVLNGRPNYVAELEK
jgi:glycoprotein 3-alpha-L-fucosyltransferase